MEEGYKIMETNLTKNEESNTTGYDITAERENMNKTLANSKEVDDLVSMIQIDDVNTIVEFGSQAADEVSKCSDQILDSMNMNQINDSGELLVTLSKIMDKFDIDEIREDEGNFFTKMFTNAKAQLDKILGKYNTMGNEVDKVYIKLKQYEDEIKGSNDKLELMFRSNTDFYRLLVKYILAGEQGLKEIDNHLVTMRADYEKSKDNTVQFDIQSLEQAKMLLEQRTHDLRIAENVAMQSIPMIKAMQFSNLNLVRKINSAFIITLPIFKQALAQAILLKRQKIQAEAMSALDQRTNEMLLKNAQNTVEQTKMTTRLASGSSIKIETLEETWKTIMTGIEETKQIQIEASKKREDEAIRLKALKKDFFDVMDKNGK